MKKINDLQILRKVSNIRPTKKEVEDMTEYEWDSLVLPVKAYKLGNANAIKEELEFLTEIYNKPYVPGLTDKIKQRMEELNEKV